MGSKGKGRGKGQGLETSGIPLNGTISQFENPSVQPNRDEPVNAFRESDDHDDSYGRDYIRDEEERLGPADEEYIPNKDDQKWSEGLQDEANESEDLSAEGMLPEIQPLHIDARSGTARDTIDDELILRPDTIDGEIDDFEDLEPAK